MIDTTGLGRDSLIEQLPALLAEKPDVLREALVARRNRLLESITAIDTEIANIQEEMSQKVEEMRKRRQPLEDAMSHLDAFLRIEGWLPTKQDSMAASYPQDGNPKAAVDAAHELLTSLGQPTHYRELAQRVIEKGIYLAGKDPAATLLSQMARDGRFKRTGRGIYGLSSWKVRASTQQRKKSRRRGAKRQH